MSGAVLTGTTIWEWNGPNAVLLSSNGVIRKPGATVVYQNTGGTLALTMADGKVYRLDRLRKGYRDAGDRQSGGARWQAIHMDGKARWARAIYNRIQAVIARRKGRLR